MVKQSENSDDRSGSPTPLPKNKEALSVISRALENLLTFLETSHHGQIQRLEEMRKTLAFPENIVQKEPLLKALALADYERFAHGAPAFTAVLPFIDPEVLRHLLDEQTAIGERLAELKPPSPCTLDECRPSIDALLQNCWQGTGAVN